MDKLLKTIGPGLLFASTSIGTSHLVLSTRAGAHHGLIFLWIILGILVLKYPFFEFGPRYASATGQSILKGYRDQGKWAVALFVAVIFINMFAVTGAVAGICGGLLRTMLGLVSVPQPFLVGGILAVTALLLVIGRYSALDRIIKGISVVLLVTVLTAFVAVLYKGAPEPLAGFVPDNQFLEGAGLALTVGLLGFMPSGLEVSVMHSIWSVETMKTNNCRLTLKESLFDFNLGYAFAAILALMFTVIGALTVYGTGQLLEGNSIEFSNKLLNVFTTNIGQWSYLIIALAAFGTIYGTLIAALDGFTRSIIQGVGIFAEKGTKNDDLSQSPPDRYYAGLVPLICLGGFVLYDQFSGGMIKVLDFATVLVFLTGPIIGFLNLRAITSGAIPASHRPPLYLILLAYFGLVVLTIIAIYYSVQLF